MILKSLHFYDILQKIRHSLIQKTNEIKINRSIGDRPYNYGSFLKESVPYLSYACQQIKVRESSVSIFSDLKFMMTNIEFRYG